MAYNDRIEDTSVDKAQREGSSTRSLQCISIRYTSVAENKTKILVSKEVTNQVINVLVECVDSKERVQLSKWKNQNPKLTLTSEISKGAPTMLEYINGFKYGATVKNDHTKMNYIRIQLSIVDGLDINNILLLDLNTGLPELHTHNKAFKAFSNCKDYVTGGCLICSNYKQIRTNDLEYVFSKGAGIRMGLYMKNLFSLKTYKDSNKEDCPPQAIHIECDRKDVSTLFCYMVRVFCNKAREEAKAGNKHSLNHSFNFIHLILALGKPRRGANNILNRVIKTQRLMYSTNM